MPLHEFASNSGVVAFTRHGLGDPMLLVHGIYPGASHHEYDSNVAAWQSTHRVFAVDLLGFGQSDAPRRAHSTQLHHHLMRDFIKHEIGEPAIVVASGLSLGIAVSLGIYDDPWVKHVVLIAPPKKHITRDPPGLADRFSQFLLGTLAVGAGHYRVASSREGLRYFLQESYHDNHAITREVIEQLFVEANEPHKMMPYISALCGYFDTDLSRWLRYVRPATQIIVGRDRLPVPSEDWLRPTAWSRGKRVDVVDDTREFPHRERPAVVNALVNDFLSADEPAAAVKPPR